MPIIILILYNLSCLISVYWCHVWLHGSRHSISVIVWNCQMKNCHTFRTFPKSDKTVTYIHDYSLLGLVLTLQWNDEGENSLNIKPEILIMIIFIKTSMWINVRENRRGNQEWTIQRNWQHSTQDQDKQNKKHNTTQYVLDNTAQIWIKHLKQ